MNVSDVLVFAGAVLELAAAVLVALAVRYGIVHRVREVADDLSGKTRMREIAQMEHAGR